MESFHAPLRAERSSADDPYRGAGEGKKCFNREVFMSVPDAGDDAAVFAVLHRPHSGLKYRTPLEFRRVWESGPAELVAVG